MPGNALDEDRDMESDRTTVLAGLIDRIRSGDADAVGDLVLAAQRRLQGLAARILNESYERLVHDGECNTLELTQELSCRLLQALREVPPNDVKHFMRLAAQQIRWYLCDLVRKPPPSPVQSFSDLSQADSESIDNSTSAGGPGETAPSPRAVEAALRKVLRNLPADIEEVVDLRFVWGLTYEEIRTQLVIDEKAVQRKLKQATLMIFEELVQVFPALDRTAAKG
jgi:RNA polymerase sigma factor (sigma-70 family)